MVATNATALAVFPADPWLQSQVVSATVSIPASCNAFYNANTVVSHEYGHGIDDNLPGGLADGSLLLEYTAYSAQQYGAKVTAGDAGI